MVTVIPNEPYVHYRQGAIQDVLGAAHASGFKIMDFGMCDVPIPGDIRLAETAATRGGTVIIERPTA